MSKPTVHSISGKVRATKRPLEVSVCFAQQSGELVTLEGTVRYSAGDALITGSAGEKWPVRRGYFEASYEPADPGTVYGKDGVYRARPREVHVSQVEEGVDVAINGGTLHAEPGDWIVRYPDGQYGVVAADLFYSLYELHEPSETYKVEER